MIVIQITQIFKVGFKILSLLLIFFIVCGILKFPVKSAMVSVD
jgi:hypothetical protein